ncbi:hypothetical protein L1887_04926 [Cichorium endivia]|nr:hypothetical protein L1887_04926 [Cichorium endivia]
MINVSALKMAEQRRLSLIVSRAMFNVLFTISLAAIVVTVTFTTDSIISNLSIHSVPITLSPFHPPGLSNQTFMVLQTKSTAYPIDKPIYIIEEVTQEALFGHYHNPMVASSKLGKEHQTELFNESLPQFDILNSTKLTRGFKKRAQVFFKEECKVRFFMTWISSSWTVFGDRELLALDALFKSNPNSCLMILSNSMDSVYGFRTLKRFTDRGFRVQAITPDLDFLFKNTPAQSWLDHIKNGKVHPGHRTCQI